MDNYSNKYWKDTLKGKMPGEWEEKINGYETEIILKKQGKIDDKVFAETRLRMGAYGQRYDNGHRHNGTESVEIPFFDKSLTKGPGTYWHAPGMERIKIPYGGVTVKQLEVMADLAEEYSDSVLHITTRQDVQLHFMHIEDTPAAFRRLAAVGITTTEACGNSVRNVTACPYAGVCSDMAFDVSPYAQAIFEFLLDHPDAQDFGRKFKIALSGCKDHPCGLTNMHDLGLIAVIKEIDGKPVKGFELWVGGGLGAVPYYAKINKEFVPADEVLKRIQAICRVFARLGEKKRRQKARIKYLVDNLGIEEFNKLVDEEIPKLKEDSRWTELITKSEKMSESAKLEPTDSKGFGKNPGENKEFDEWCTTNLRPQSQAGYTVVSVTLPLGDFSSNQARGLADLAGKFVNDTIRTTVEQNLVFRWVRNEDVFAVFQGLQKIGLADPGAESIVDVTACPGTDTCKLGIASSRGLAAELRKNMADKSFHLNQSLDGMRVKVSGCFNACSQHHLADIGFYGNNRNVNGYGVPFFQLILGGKFGNNGEKYGLAISSYPSKAIPKVVDNLIDTYLAKKQNGETFNEYTGRVGKKEILANLKPLIKVPAYEVDPSYYRDWADIREFSVKDIGIGECAGEVITLADFGLKKADREIFDSQVQMDDGDAGAAQKTAFNAMKHAAQALVKNQNIDISEDPEEILKEFTTHYIDTGLILDPFMGDKFVDYYLSAHEVRDKLRNDEKTQHLIEEARLFVDSAHKCNLNVLAATNKIKASGQAK